MKPTASADQENSDDDDRSFYNTTRKESLKVVSWLDKKLRIIHNRDVTLWYRDQNNPRGCTGVVSLDFNWNFPRYKRVHREHVTKHNRKHGVHFFESRSVLRISFSLPSSFLSL